MSKQTHWKNNVPGNVSVHEFHDDSGDGLQIDVHESYVEMVTYHQTGCFVVTDPETLRGIAKALNDAADMLESE